MGPQDPSEFETGTFRDGFAHGMDEESVSELLKEASYHAKTLFRSEVELARKELTQAAKASGQAAGIAAGGAFLAAVGFMALTACVILGLAGGIAAWLSALIVGVVWCGAAAACFFVAKSQFQKLEAPRTRRHLTEDKQWIQSTVERVKSPSRVNA